MRLTFSQQSNHYDLITFMHVMPKAKNIYFVYHSGMETIFEGFLLTKILAKAINWGGIVKNGESYGNRIHI